MQLAPSALHATAETLGGYLDWTPNELIIDDVVSLDGPQDRHIGMRLTGNGSSIQLWATGGAEPTDPQPADSLAPLPRGHRWHTWVHIGRLEADGDPATVLYDAITDRLLPVFDTKPLYVGHRPWEDRFDSALSEVLDESTPGTSLRDCDPEAHTTPNDAGEGVGQAVNTDPAATPDESTTPAADETGQPDPEAAPTPEPQAPAEPAAKVIPMPTRRAKPAKADTAAAASDPKPRTSRKRTPAKADAPAAASDPKPRTSRKRTPAKADAPAAASDPKPRTSRKRTPAKPTTS
ncbi:hypothetical protein ACWD48_06215 [Streptomyces sp. NPDC002519]